MAEESQKKIVKKRPLGAVKCSNCDECKNNGYGVAYRWQDSDGFHSENTILCDKCLKKIE